LAWHLIVAIFQYMPFSPTFPTGNHTQKMPTPSTKLTTRASNANKHPGVPDQAKKKCSLAQMAAIRASEKAAKKAKEAAALAAPLIIAGVEDSMEAADKDNKEGAA
jgi:hypothetical protein